MAKAPSPKATVTSVNEARLAIMVLEASDANASNALALFGNAREATSRHVEDAPPMKRPSVGDGQYHLPSIVTVRNKKLRSKWKRWMGGCHSCWVHWPSVGHCLPGITIRSCSVEAGFAALAGLCSRCCGSEEEQRKKKTRKHQDEEMAREAHRSRERQSSYCATIVKAPASGVMRCYALKAVGSSGLIAAPVLGRAVRVNGHRRCGQCCIALPRS